MSQSRNVTEDIRTFFSPQNKQLTRHALVTERDIKISPFAECLIGFSYYFPTKGMNEFDTLRSVRSAVCNILIRKTFERHLNFI